MRTKKVKATRRESADRALGIPNYKLCRHLLAMFVEQVPVDFPDQDAPVLVSHPGRDCHEVDAGHDAERAEQVPQIVKSNSRELGMSADKPQGFPQATRGHIFFTALGTGEEP